MAADPVRFRVRPLVARQARSFADGGLPEVEELREGVLALPIPFADERMRFTYCYLLLGPGREVHLIDPGTDSDGNWSILLVGLDHLGRGIDDVTSITVTHLHLDHLGLAGRLQQASGAPVRAHSAERTAIVVGRGTSPWDGPAEWWGVPPREAHGLSIHRDLDRVLDAGLDLDPVEDGELLEFGGRRLEVVWTPGHTVGHMCLLDAENDLLFSGDHVLPVTTPGVGLGGAFNDPVTRYLDSLERVSGLATAVAPGHEFAFLDLEERCAELRARHLRRADEVAAALERDPRATVWEIASRARKDGAWASLSGKHRRMALTQTAMHVERITGAQL